MPDPAGSTTSGQPGRGYGSLGQLLMDLLEAAEAGGAAGTGVSADQAFESFLDWTLEQGYELWPHQEDALMALASGNHVILGTPTGSGKSLVALGMCFFALATGRVAYYTAPIKALVSEKFFQLVDVFGAENVGMITGDVSLNAQAPLICCTAEILANQALCEGAGSDIGCVAMDEFHYFGDTARGHAWQIPLLSLPQTQFLLMSATLGDTSHIARLVEERTRRSVDVVADAPRPVPLEYHFVDTALEGTVELALRRDEAPIYVVHFAQDAALSSAQSLASYGVSSKEQRNEIKDALKGTRFTTPFGKILQRLLGMGVGVHHAGMLPRYRLLVEKLAQQGLLPVVCGTDTLGVGINVPIHTVLLTQLTKFDGSHMRKLGPREFHQIAGRAGRAGFDTKGVVLVQATEYEIENAKALAKAGGDPKKARNFKKKTPPPGFVGWDKNSFERLVASTPAPLTPRMKMTHAMMLGLIQQGGDARGRARELIDASLVADATKSQLKQRTDEILRTLVDAGVVQFTPDGETGAATGRDSAMTVDAADAGAAGSVSATGSPEAAAGGIAAQDNPFPPGSYTTTVELPDNFALDQPLSPFLLAALELLDPESPTYALDLVSLVEATLDDPVQILRVQTRRARDEAMAQMKADDIPYGERTERIKEVSYPQPLKELLQDAFDLYCEQVPWARDFALSPKSVLRDMLENAADFKGYISSMGIARSEGLLLRYLSDAFRVLDRTIPPAFYNGQLRDIVSWLGYVVRNVDSSLVDEWNSAGSSDGATDLAPALADQVVADRRALTVLVRNALFQRVRLLVRDDAAALGDLDSAWGFTRLRWQQVLDSFYDAHEDALLDADARSAAYFELDDSDEKTAHTWHVHQIILDTDHDCDFGIWADVDLDATQEQGEVIFTHLEAGEVTQVMQRRSEEKPGQ